MMMPASAQVVSPLPGGATALSEAHGDWTVKCGIRESEPVKVCGLTQEQFDGNSARVLAIEMFPLVETAAGTLVLPFGFALDSGVQLSVDDGAPVASLRFSTCTPGGCLVPFEFGPDIVATLRAGGVLHVKGVVNETQKEAALKVSLKGFAGALDRTISLLQ